VKGKTLEKESNNDVLQTYTHVLFFTGASETIFEMTIPAAFVCVPELADGAALAVLAAAAALFLPSQTYQRITRLLLHPNFAMALGFDKKNYDDAATRLRKCMMILTQYTSRTDKQTADSKYC